MHAPVDEESFQRLKSAGMDDVLSRHIAHLFSRCPLVVFDDRIDMDDEEETEHFENLQSTCLSLLHMFLSDTFHMHQLEQRAVQTAPCPQRYRVEGRVQDDGGADH